MEITTVGLDIAKLVFQVHGVDQEERVVLRKQLKRQQVMAFFASLPPCVVAMEACATANYWGRRIESVGHTVKLIAPQYVRPYVKTNKNDAVDAEGICIAARRPNMRCVPLKSVEQQEILCLHRARAGFEKERTAHANQIRGLLGEFGVVIPQGIRNVFKEVPRLLDDPAVELPARVRELMDRLLQHLKELDRHYQELERQITLWHRQCPASRRLEAIPGVGPLTASALVGTAGQAEHFSSGRELASSFGVVPKQHSTGGKQRLLGISKRGDRYVRKLVIHGARSVVKVVQRRPATDERSRWLLELIKRRGPNIAAVALANKNLRTAWALLAHGREFDPGYAAA